MKDDQLFDQVRSRCIHFTGLFQNETCEAGVRYADVKGDGFLMIPCLKKGGVCDKSVFPTDEEAQAQVNKINQVQINTLAAYARIKKQYAAGKELTGKVPCQCGGEVRYSIAESNKHIWAKCNKCEVMFNE